MEVTERSDFAWFRAGVKNGIPISLGYFAVALALGIPAKTAGLTAFQAMLACLLTNASAGAYAAFSMIGAAASMLEFAIMQFVANARYLLMSAALSQKLSPDLSMRHRLGIGFAVTDEIFGAAIAVPGKLNPFFYYGMMAIAIPGWASGVFVGVVLGNVLPLRVVSALSVALYGMFIAVFIPPCRKSGIIAGLVAVSFALSYAVNRLALFSFISSGMKTILLTVLISAAAAVLFPRKEESDAV